MVPSWSDTTITWDGEIVAAEVTKEQIQQGVTVEHSDGRVLTVILPEKTLPLPKVRVDDHPYAISGQDHRRTVKEAKGVLLLLAVVNIFLPLYASVKPESKLAQLASDPSILYLGLVCLGLFIWSQYSAKWPIGIGTVVCSVSLTLAVMSAVRAGANVVSFPFFMRFVFLVFLIRGFLAARTIESRYLNTTIA